MPMEELSYMRRYYAVSFTGLKRARKDLNMEQLMELAIEETADFFEISKDEVKKELNL